MTIESGGLPKGALALWLAVGEGSSRRVIPPYLRVKKGGGASLAVCRRDVTDASPSFFINASFFFCRTFSFPSNPGHIFQLY